MFELLVKLKSMQGLRLLMTMQAKLEVMDLYYFVYNFVIFSLIDDYDNVFGDLE